MPTGQRRIQITEDRELAAALHAAVPYLPPGLPRSQQVRELALAGARCLATEQPDKAKRRELLGELADHFRQPATAPWDWEALRDGKHRAWPIR